MQRHTKHEAKQMAKWQCETNGKWQWVLCFDMHVKTMANPLHAIACKASAG